MDVQSTTAATQSGTSTSQSSNASASSALSSDFETFLLMLTTQMQNQDPLNPIESQDFAVQLATFSGVEQQVQTNKLLESLSGALGLSGLLQLAGWVGMEARVSVPAQFDGTPISLAYTPATGADSATLIVRDATGTEVSREQVPLSTTTVAWAGVAGDGSPLPSGTYSFELESMGNGQVIETSPVSHYATVTQARQGSAGVEIVLKGGTSVAAADVSALRQPGAG